MDSHSPSLVSLIYISFGQFFWVVCANSRRLCMFALSRSSGSNQPWLWIAGLLSTWQCSNRHTRRHVSLLLDVKFLHRGIYLIFHDSVTIVSARSSFKTKWIGSLIGASYLLCATVQGQIQQCEWRVLNFLDMIWLGSIRPLATAHGYSSWFLR
jgi:hypothetical protein